MSRLTSEAGAGVAVPVVAAVAVNRTGAGAAGVRHAAARLHIHLPRLRQTQRPAHTQTLQANKQTNVYKSMEAQHSWQIFQMNLRFLISTKLSGE